MGDCLPPVEEIPVVAGWTDLADKIGGKGRVGLWSHSQMKNEVFDISLIGKMNLDNLTFTPNFNPSVRDDVVMDDIDQTQEKMSDDFQSRIQA